MNRLERKLLWWRHAWFFHWAHKPLCEPYAEDVLRIGRLRLCRGCAMIAAGFLATAGALLLGRPELPWLLAGFLAGYGLAAAGSHPAIHSRWPRWGKDALRLAAGSAPASVAAMLFSGHGLAALGATLVLGATWLLYARLRRGRRLEKCADCPELGAGICSGYALQADAICAWEEDCVGRILGRGHSRIENQRMPPPSTVTSSETV